MVFEPTVKVIQHLVEPPLVDTTYSTLFCPKCICAINDQYFQFGNHSPERTAEFF